MGKDFSLDCFSKKKKKRFRLGQLGLVGIQNPLDVNGQAQVFVLQIRNPLG